MVSAQLKQPAADPHRIQLEQLNTHQQAIESKIEELLILKKEFASRMWAVEQQLSAETAKLVSSAKKREEIEKVLDSLPDKIPDLIAAQTILFQKHRTAMKPIMALELERDLTE